MTLVVATEPSSLVAVADQCAAVEAWAERCESIPELQNATNKLAAIDEYLNRTSTEGRGRVAAAMRRLEMRIGNLLGPASPNGKNLGLLASNPDNLTPKQRHEFRQMAENEDVVEDVIAESSDEDPASRRRVTESIRNVVPRRVLTEEELQAKEEEDAIRRNQGRLIDLIRGWIELVGLHANPLRAQTLRGLTNDDRKKVLEIEAIYLRGKR